MRLIEFTENDHPFGNQQGRAALLKLSDYIDDHEADIYEISLEGIVATDASFPRESVISLAKMHKGDKGFYLTGQLSKDLLDNWHYAAMAKEQPLILKQDGNYKIIGPAPKAGAKDLLDFVMEEGVVTTAKVVQKFGGSAQNASAKLKKLFAAGLIIGHKAVAESGGLEFIYKAIK
ncbi:hypothetical protein ACVBEJ_14100 [Porticoccus sp. GXU_MW_L64]